MAVLTQKEFMEKLNKIIGERTDDEALDFIADCKDTITSDGDEWKQKYDEQVKANEELEKSWREKYKARFFASDDIPKDNTNNNDTNPAKPKPTETDEEQAKLEQANKIRFDDLFKPTE